jgi:long-subunit acyl-CoA synthetase (AMP-forming)
MFDRYLNKPEATLKEFHENWFKTGDYVEMQND